MSHSKMCIVRFILYAPLFFSIINFPSSVFSRDFKKSTYDSADLYYKYIFTKNDGKIPKILNDLRKDNFQCKQLPPDKESQTKTTYICRISFCSSSGKSEILIGIDRTISIPNLELEYTKRDHIIIIDYMTACEN